MKKTAEELRRLMELRRSNAATPLRNKKPTPVKLNTKNLTYQNKNVIIKIKKGPHETKT